MADINFGWYKKSWLLPEITKNTEEKWDWNQPSIGIAYLKRKKPNKNTTQSSMRNQLGVPPKCNIQSDSK